MITFKNSAATTANNETLYTVKETAKMFGVTDMSIYNWINKGIISPSCRVRNKYNRRDMIMFTAEDIEHIRQIKNLRPSIQFPETVKAESDQTEQTTLATVNPDNPFSILKAMNKACEQDNNFKAMMKLRSEFEHMNEQQLQIRFSEMLKRFKFKYIIENVKSVQSQTLTCIAKGKLRGIDRYKLSFSSYLELLEFCYNNSCPVAEIQ